MLDCKHDRLDYGELLRPPQGYRLDQAVATTYSADLGTLLALPIALLFSHTLEGDLSETRFQLLDAIKRFAKQVTIYHQKGQIHVPAKLSFLHAFLEDALVPVLPDDAFSAFHPKVWVIRYVSHEDTSASWFRVLVLSRNLTFDRSWDVAACIDGRPGKNEQELNQPLADFIRWLHGIRPIPAVEQFLAELLRTDFQLDPPFESFRFCPSGIPNYSGVDYLPKKAKRTLVISPFLHERALGRIAEQTREKPLVFSMRHELEKLPRGVVDAIEPYCLSDLVIDGEFMEEADETASDIQRQALHAKLFISRYAKESKWLLGSANATEAAFTRNVEFMLELAGTAPRIEIRRRRRELLGEEEGAGPFVPFDPESGGKDVSEEISRQQQARRFEHALLKSDLRGRLEPGEEGRNFDLHLDFDLTWVPILRNTFLSVQPLAAKQKFSPQVLAPGHREQHVFRNIGELELSRFVQFLIESPKNELLHQFLVMIPIDGLPADRLDNIFRKVIDTQDKFFQYLGFLLDDNPVKEDLLGNGDQEGVGFGTSEEVCFHLDLPIYERLLLAASRSPRKLSEVDEIIRRLEDSGENKTSVVPSEFVEFWEAFRSIVPAGRETGKA